MHSTKYLYSCKPTEFMNLPYIEALHYKVMKAELLITELLKPHYRDRDFAHLRDVQSARTFNQTLINELKLPKENKVKLNTALLEQQNISDTTKQEIEKLHNTMDKLKSLKIGEVADIPVYVKSVQTLEFAMQELWKFNQDPAFHTHWFYDPKCKCPIMDNQDMLGVDRSVIRADCPLHGSEGG